MLNHSETDHPAVPAAAAVCENASNEDAACAKRPSAPVADSETHAAPAPVTIAISGECETREQRAHRRFLNVWSIVGGIVLAGVLVYLLNILSAPVGILLWACVIVFCLRGPVNWLERHGVNRTIGTVVAYVLMVIVLGLLALLMFSPAFGFGEQFVNLIESVPTYAQQIADWAGGLYEKYGYLLQNDTVKEVIDNVGAALSGWAGETAKVSAEGLVAIGGAIASSVMVIGFAMVVAFWVLMELPAIGRECYRIVGEKRREDAHMLYLTFTRVMGGYIKATIVQCLLIGVACGIAFAIIGVPNYAALGGIAGLLNIIPVVGPWLGGALAAIACVFVSPITALVAVIATIVIQQFVYTFVSPKLMSNSVDVHPAVVFIALLSGSAIGGAMSGFLGGLVGMLASIPAVAVLKALFVYYFEKHTGRRIVAEDGVFFKGSPPGGEDGSIDPLVDIAPPNPQCAKLSRRVPHGTGGRTDNANKEN